MRRRTEIHTISFVARCESGLHIGGSQDELAIGGSDNPVIKNPASGKPYIPGSSLKGKMRAEMEKQWGKSGGNGDNPCDCAKPSCAVCMLFGAHTNKSALGPSRIIVRDGRLRPQSGWQIENKTENVINRRTGAAQHPRTNERVAEGAEFDLQVVLQVFDTDEGFSYDWGGTRHQGGAALQAVVAHSLKLVQLTGMGGGTSRGSGAVKFRDFQVDGTPWAHWSD